GDYIDDQVMEDEQELRGLPATTKDEPSPHERGGGQMHAALQVGGKGVEEELLLLSWNMPQIELGELEGRQTRHGDIPLGPAGRGLLVAQAEGVMMLEQEGE